MGTIKTWAMRGMVRCSKSCRLRWTNYLRPGIKHGNFSCSDEEIIIHLQSLLGNRWAKIASYLPGRTDNDVKNYWNTHLKKKIMKSPKFRQPQVESTTSQLDSAIRNRLEYYNSNHESSSSGPNKCYLNHQTCKYLSAENISRLLKDWSKSSLLPLPLPPPPDNVEEKLQLSSTNAITSNHQEIGSKRVRDYGEQRMGFDDLVSVEDFESLLEWKSTNAAAQYCSSPPDTTILDLQQTTHAGRMLIPISASPHHHLEKKLETDNLLLQPPMLLFLLENWLLGEPCTTGPATTEQLK